MKITPKLKNYQFVDFGALEDTALKLIAFK